MLSHSSPRLPASSQEVHVEGILTAIAQDEGTCPRSHNWQKQMQDIVTTLPTRYSSHWPTLFLVACSEPGIQEALNSSFISFSRASWLRPWQSGQRAEGRGHRGRPYSGTCGYNSARVMQAVSLHGLQPTSAGCLHLRQVYQANLWTYHLPTHPFIVHTN